MAARSLVYCRLWDFVAVQLLRICSLGLLFTEEATAKRQATTEVGIPTRCRWNWFSYRWNGLMRYVD